MSEEKISLTMTTTSTAGKTATKSITDINDNASDGELLTFASAFNNLTTNTLGTVAKVTKRELDDTPAVNPIVSVAAEPDVTSVYTVTGSGTTYTVNVNLSGFANIDDPLDNKMVKITLANGVYGEIYNGRYQAACTANPEEAPGNSGWIGALVWLGREEDGEGQDTFVYVCPVAWNKNSIESGTITNLVVTFPATTVGSTTYAAWTITFTFN